MLNQRELEQIVAALKPMTVYKVEGLRLVSLEEIIGILNTHMEGNLKITLGDWKEKAEMVKCQYCGKDFLTCVCR